MEIKGIDRMLLFLFIPGTYTAFGVKFRCQGRVMCCCFFFFLGREMGGGRGDGGPPSCCNEVSAQLETSVSTLKLAKARQFVIRNKCMGTSIKTNVN